jgi:hypothetical protein
MAMIAMTTRSSMSVKAAQRERRSFGKIGFIGSGVETMAGMMGH